MLTVRRLLPGRARAWLVSLCGVALVLVVGIQVAGRDDPGRTDRPVPTPAKNDDASNAKIIDKDQRVDVDTFGQKDSPLRPLVEELRSAVPQHDPTTTTPDGDD